MAVNVSINGPITANTVTIEAVSWVVDNLYWVDFGLLYCTCTICLYMLFWVVYIIHMHMYVYAILYYSGLILGCFPHMQCYFGVS